MAAKWDLKSNKQVEGYEHEVADMGAWDKDSDGEEWPTIENIEDRVYRENQACHHSRPLGHLDITLCK
jgi:hypothetical protein